MSRNAIAKLVGRRMAEKDWSGYDVARQGGPPARTVNHWADPTVVWTNLPKPETAEKMAIGLRLPLVRVQQAILETLGYEITTMSVPPDIQMVMGAMSELTPDRQKTVADMVLRLAEDLRQ